MLKKTEGKRTGRPAAEIPLDTLGGKIRAARKKKSISAEALGKKIGIKHQSLTAIERNKVEPEARTLILLAQELREDFGQPWLREHIKPEPENTVIEIKARVAAGDAVEYYMQGEDMDSIEVDPSMTRRRGRYFALRVSGESMEGAHVLNGDIVIVREVPKTYQPSRKDLVIADIQDEGITLKRWKTSGDQVVLISAAKGYKEIRRPADRVKPVAVVVGVVRMLS